MKFSTAFKIMGVCLLALAVELILAYLVFSNYAFSLAETGQYSMREAYASGPMAGVAKVFYGIFALTVGVGAGAPLFALVSRLFRARPAP